MTQLLEKAFAQASTLPEAEQNALAQRMLAEMASEQRWDELFLASQEELAALAQETLAQQRAEKQSAWMLTSCDFLHHR